MAVLLLEDESNWLALASGLKTIGVPFRITRDVDTAMGHDIVLAYPQITGVNLAPDDSRALRAFVDGGGTLIGTNVLGGGLNDLFGFDRVFEGKSDFRLRFEEGPAETADFSAKGLTTIKFGSATEFAFNPGANRYAATTAEVLARYPDGGAAILRQDFGAGRSYALGIDPGQLLAKGYNRRQVDITDHYANHYQPTLDAFLILLETIYKAQEAPKAVLGTVPNGRSLSVIISHDVDYSKSLRNAIPYAQHQNAEGFSGTYFIQTKYLRDYNDEIFFGDDAKDLIGQLDALGAEIASHSVAHSNAMWDFDIGDGTERYPDYRPFVRTAKRTDRATLLGEVRVSKFLLEAFTEDQTVTSFRPGFLANPAAIPQVLDAAGYQYSSSSTAGVSLTHLPFQLTYDRAFSSLTPIFEFPITVEDELDGPMIDRLDEGIALARQIAQIEGLFVALIHTDAVDGRLDYQKALVEEVQPYAWLGSLRDFGDWWAARDQVSVDVFEMSGDQFMIKLDAPSRITGLTVELNKEAEIVESTLPLSTLSQSERSILIDTLEGSQTITLRRTPG